MKIDKYFVDPEEVESIEVFEKFGSHKSFDDGTKRKSNSSKKQNRRKEKPVWQ